MKPYLLWIIVPLSIFLISCGDNKKSKEKFPDTDMYDISSPKVISLPQVVDEISGIVYYPKDTSVFAIIDEEGMLFKIPLKNPKQFRSWPFDKKRDYEDLLLIDSTFYILVSNGDMVRVRFDNDKVNSTKIDGSSVSKTVNEFEAMYLDSNKIIIVCKECKTDEKNIVSSFAYNLTDTLQTDSLPVLTDHKIVDLNRVFNEIGKDNHMKVSAAAIHPLNHDIYLISSVEKLLVILDRDGKVKSYYKLDPKIYKQPEGMAFTPEGDLIISNEFADVGMPNLLLMKNKKRQ